MGHASPVGQVRAVRRTTAPREREDPGEGIGRATALATGALVLGVVPLFVVLPHDQLAGPFMLPFLAWPLLCLAGAVALDRAPHSRTAWSAVAVGATVPAGVVLLAILRPAEVLVGEVAALVESLSPWLLAGLVVPAMGGESVRRGPSTRRWRAWLALSGLATAAVAGPAWQRGAETTYAVVGCAGVAVTAWLVVATTTSRPPPPMVETAVDLVLAAGVVTVAVGVGLLVARFAEVEQVRGATALGWVAGLAAMALALPSAAWARREHLRRRYGPGVLDPADLAAVSAGLATEAGPRELLGRLARMVVNGSGLAEVRVLLDEVTAPPGWQARALTVGDARVGTLLLRAPRDGTIERRHEAVVDRLAPTLALAVRAVELAVDAEHARTDTELQRERERRRILRDLHDDLGPVLAGLAMRVAAEREVHPGLGVLDDVADALAGCQSELRRIVTRLTPSVLDDASLGEALRGLVDAFGGSRGIVVSLEGEVPDAVSADVAAVVYRTVAEGVTNAVRHARPRRIEVRVRRVAAEAADVGSGSQVEVLVRDDGRGGPVVPGTGLASLRARAEELDGTLELDGTPDGTTLRLTIREQR